MGTTFSSSEEEGEELEQEPEMPLFEHSSSPLSPQISMSRSPFFGPSMRNSDPFHAVTPQSPTSGPARQHNVGSAVSPGPFLPSWLLAVEDFHLEVYLIRHAQSTANTRPKLIGGRTPSATLTDTGRHEAGALGEFLRSTGVVFDAMYCSPLERARETADFVCEALEFSEEQVEMVDALQELSQGQWEGRSRSEVYTREIVQLMNSSQPDFRAPGGESQRQVEFRMVEFLNNILLPHAAIALQEEAKLDKNKGVVYPELVMEEYRLRESEITTSKEAELVETVNASRNYGNNSENGSDSNGDDSHRMMDDTRNQTFRRDKLPKILTRKPDPPPNRGAYRVAVFSHGLAIKCALRGLLGSDPHRTQQICIDNSSVTVLRHSGSTGWQVQRVNDTAHLRLL